MEEKKEERERKRGKTRQKREERRKRERGGREAGAGWYATVADTKCVMRVCAGVSAHMCLGTSIYNIYSFILSIDCLITIPNVDNHV